MKHQCLLLLLLLALVASEVRGSGLRGQRKIRRHLLDKASEKNRLAVNIPGVVGTSRKLEEPDEGTLALLKRYEFTVVRARRPLPDESDSGDYPGLQFADSGDYPVVASEELTKGEERAHPTHDTKMDSGDFAGEVMHSGDYPAVGSHNEAGELTEEKVKVATLPDESNLNSGDFAGEVIHSEDPPAVGAYESKDELSELAPEESDMYSGDLAREVVHSEDSPAVASYDSSDEPDKPTNGKGKGKGKGNEEATTESPDEPVTEPAESTEEVTSGTTLVLVPFESEDDLPMSNHESEDGPSKGSKQTSGANAASNKAPSGKKSSGGNKNGGKQANAKQKYTNNLISTLKKQGGKTSSYKGSNVQKKKGGSSSSYKKTSKGMLAKRSKSSKSKGSKGMKGSKSKSKSKSRSSSGVFSASYDESVPELTSEDEEEAFCSKELFQCPDGSFVGRIPPDCLFALCPDDVGSPDDGVMTDAPDEIPDEPEPEVEPTIVPIETEPTLAPIIPEGEDVMTDAPDLDVITDAPDEEDAMTDAPVDEDVMTDAPDEEVTTTEPVPVPVGRPTMAPVGDRPTQVPDGVDEGVMTDAPDDEEVMTVGPEAEPTPSPDDSLPTEDPATGEVMTDAPDDQEPEIATTAPGDVMTDAPESTSSPTQQPPGTGEEGVVVPETAAPTLGGEDITSPPSSAPSIAATSGPTSEREQIQFTPAPTEEPITTETTAPTDGEGDAVLTSAPTESPGAEEEDLVGPETVAPTPAESPLTPETAAPTAMGEGEEITTAAPTETPLTTVTTAPTSTDEEVVMTAIPTEPSATETVAPTLGEEEALITSVPTEPQVPAVTASPTTAVGEEEEALVSAMPSGAVTLAPTSGREVFATAAPSELALIETGAPTSGEEETVVITAVPTAPTTEEETLLTAAPTEPVLIQTVAPTSTEEEALVTAVPTEPQDLIETTVPTTPATEEEAILTAAPTEPTEILTAAPTLGEEDLSTTAPTLDEVEVGTVAPTEPLATSVPTTTATGDKEITSAPTDPLETVAPTDPLIIETAAPTLGEEDTPLTTAPSEALNATETEAPTNVTDALNISETVAPTNVTDQETATLGPSESATMMTAAPTSNLTVTQVPIPEEAWYTNGTQGCDQAILLEVGDVVPGIATFSADNEVGGCFVDLKPLFPEAESQESIQQLGVWYSVEATDTRLRASACTGTDSNATFVVSVYGGQDGCSDLTCAPVYNTAGCSVEWVASSAFEIYFILVQSFFQVSSDANSYLEHEFFIEEVAAPVNDVCEEAIPLRLGDSIAGRVLTASERDFEGSCALELQPPSPNVLIPGVWYSFTGDGGSFSASACGENTEPGPILLTIYSGTCDNLQCESTEVSSDPCAATISDTVERQVYYVLVEKLLRGSEEGVFEITLDI